MELEEAKNRFTMGATSHMANVAFDKHVQFCEEYTQGVNEALVTLFRQGVHREALAKAIDLSVIRRKWVLWATPSIDTQLEKFEIALGKIGSNARLVEDFA